MSQWLVQYITITYRYLNFGRGNDWFYWDISHFPGVLVKLRKANIKLRQVCPSVRMEQLGSYWKCFHRISEDFSKNVETIQVSFTSDNNKPVVYLKTYAHLWKYLAEFSLEWQIFQTNLVVKIKTHLLLNNINPKNRVLYEIMWKNMVEPEGPLMTIWRNAHCMLHTLRLQTSTNNMFLLQQRLHERASVLRLCLFTDRSKSHYRHELYYPSRSRYTRWFAQHFLSLCYPCWTNFYFQKQWRFW
jgi:hypothetical protein